MRRTFQPFKAYARTTTPSNKLYVNTTKDGESIELKVERMMLTNEKVEVGAKPIFTERKDGVLPQYDIRTDRFEIAVDAADKIQKSYSARREAAIKSREEAKPTPQQHDPGPGAGSNQQS